MSRLRLALVPDYAEEGWPSMDLAADLLAATLRAEHAHAVEVDVLRPAWRGRLGRVPRVGRNLDRLLNRFVDYPRHLRRAAAGHDAFHVADHSYAHLVLALPAERTGVLCHDLDTFRCLLGQERRPRWFRAMARRILRGLQRAALVFVNSRATRDALAAHALVDPARVVEAPLGVAPELVPDGPPPPVDGPFALHVGSTIPRKRLDVLLRVFAEVRARHPALLLVRVGGALTEEQRALAERLGVAASIRSFEGLPRAALAALYRGAAVVLQPSDAEGFGLPVAEALACGARVVASDIPALREVGGDAVVLCPVGDVAAWAAAVDRLLSDPAAGPDRAARLARAARFTWSAHARTVLAGYARLAGRG